MQDIENVQLPEVVTEESYAAYLAAGGQSNGVLENKLRNARQRNATVNPPGSVDGPEDKGRSAPSRFGQSKGLAEPSLKTT